MESYYPVMLNVQGRRCLVAGGGPVAQRKVQGLLECGAEVVLVSPAVTPSLAELARQGMILLLAREYESGDLTGSMLVFALTNQRQVNAKIAEEAARAGIPVNVADEAEEGDFILPAVVRRGPLVLTVSTSGASPAYAGRIKDELAERYDEDLISYVRWLGRLRGHIMRQVSDSGLRRKLLREAIHCTPPEDMEDENESRLILYIEQLKQKVKRKGHLVHEQQNDYSGNKTERACVDADRTSN
ncbi:precorrin-2 dehydrogenase/sirohydrochlorin ferrochelatase family protein [Paenibacillus pinihumi]|uniref:precorrin-2 dehydrogenase/sirohydrochlorin ferrochelatase family protein n=1 Tax=Paenibacillus pinihumi TaxID=669462 RepID=UPI0003FE808E|nr:bifunctional precorrin-2 dehydrogenase/sirohydrochlorin ferrochelatase [Paenibacillus pinihumi]